VGINDFIDPIERRLFTYMPQLAREFHPEHPTPPPKSDREFKL